MWIRGRRRGGAKKLSDHLRNAEDNEKIIFHEFEGFAFDKSNGPNLELALKQMEAIGYGKGDPRNLFHVIFAAAYGETLNKKQRDFMVNYYREHMGFRGHQFALVEHWKHGKQHFHLVFNIIHPDTGKTHELKFTKYKEWRISRGLEEIFGLSTPKPLGKSIPTWAIQRGNRSGINPIKAKKDITAIFHASRTTKDFIAALDQAGFALTRGRCNQLVLVDKAGDTHGLMRMIEGQKLADLKRKFHGIDTLPYPPHARLVKMWKASKGQQTISPLAATPLKKITGDVQRAYKTSQTGAEFFAKLNKREYSFGRSLKGFVLIDKNGDRHDLNSLLGKDAAKGFAKQFSDLGKIKPSPLTELVRRIRTGKPSRLTRHPLGRMKFQFSMAGRGITRRHDRPHFSSRGGHVVKTSGLAALIVRLSKMARVRAVRPESKHHHFPMMRRRKRKGDENIPDSEKMPFRRPEWETAEWLAWAAENGRSDVLAEFGIITADSFEP
jgi:hypothetical protein